VRDFCRNDSIFFSGDDKQVPVVVAYEIKCIRVCPATRSSKYLAELQPKRRLVGLCGVCGRNGEAQTGSLDFNCCLQRHIGAHAEANEGESGRLKALGPDHFVHLLDTLLQSGSMLPAACATVTDEVKSECLYALCIEERTKFSESIGDCDPSSVE
jgi:hypothetical protein